MSSIALNSFVPVHELLLAPVPPLRLMTQQLLECLVTSWGWEPQQQRVQEWEQRQVQRFVDRVAGLPTHASDPAAACRLLQQHTVRPATLDMRELCELLQLPVVWSPHPVPVGALQQLIDTRHALAHNALATFHGRISLLERQQTVMHALRQACAAAEAKLSDAGREDDVAALQSALAAATSRIRIGSTGSASSAEAAVAAAAHAHEDGKRELQELNDHAKLLLKAAAEKKDDLDAQTGFLECCAELHRALHRAAADADAAAASPAAAAARAYKHYMLSDGAALRLISILHVKHETYITRKATMVALEHTVEALPLQVQEPLFALLAAAAEANEHVALYLTATELTGPRLPACPLPVLLRVAAAHTEAVMRTLPAAVRPFVYAPQFGAHHIVPFLQRATKDPKDAKDDEFIPEEEVRNEGGQLMQLRVPSAREKHSRVLHHLLQALSTAYATVDSRSLMVRLADFHGPQHVPMQIVHLIADAYVLAVGGLDRSIAAHAATLLRAAARVDQRVLCGFVYKLECNVDKDYTATTKPKPALGRIKDCLTWAVLTDFVGSLQRAAAVAAAEAPATSDAAALRAEVAAYIARDAFAHIVKGPLPHSLVRLQAGQAALAVALQNESSAFVPLLSSAAVRKQLTSQLTSQLAAAPPHTISDTTGEDDHAVEESTGDDEESEEQHEEADEDDADEEEEEEEEDGWQATDQELDERRDAYGRSVRQAAVADVLQLLSPVGHLSRWRANGVTLIYRLSTKHSGGAADADLSTSLTGFHLQKLHEYVVEKLDKDLGENVGDAGGRSASGGAGNTTGGARGGAGGAGAGAGAGAATSQPRLNGKEAKYTAVVHQIQQAELVAERDTASDTSGVIRSIRRYSAYAQQQAHRGGSRIELLCDLPGDLFHAPMKPRNLYIASTQELARQQLALAVTEKILSEEGATRLQMLLRLRPDGDAAAAAAAAAASAADGGAGAGATATPTPTAGPQQQAKTRSMAGTSREDLDVKLAVETFLRCAEALRHPSGPEVGAPQWRDALAVATLELSFEDIAATFRGRDKAPGK